MSLAGTESLVAMYVRYVQWAATRLTDGRRLVYHVQKNLQLMMWGQSHPNSAMVNYTEYNAVLILYQTLLKFDAKLKQPYMGSASPRYLHIENVQKICLGH